MTTIQDRIPSPGRRTRRLPDAVRRAAWALTHTATAVVVVSLAVASAAGWATPTARGCWTVAVAAAAAGVLTGLLRSILGPCVHGAAQPREVLGSLFVAVLVWAFAATFAFSLSYFLHAHALDRHAVRKVPATVSRCVRRSEDDNLCTYHWRVDGHTYSSREGAAEDWPDGHRVTVRIDPAHPGRSAQVSRGYWALWAGIVIGALGTLLAVLAAWLTDSRPDRM